MKKCFLSFALFVLFAPTVLGQTPEAQKIDEFGSTNCDDYRARMDNLLVKLETSPGAKGYVIVYEGDTKKFAYDKNNRIVGTEYVPSEKGIAKILVGYFENHLRFRNFPAQRIVFIDGGFREKLAVELWFATDGSNPPKPSPTLKKIKQTKAKRRAEKFCSEP